MSEGGGVTVRWCKSQIVSNEEKVGILGILVIYALPAAGWAGVNSLDTDIDMTKDTFIIVLVLLSQMLLLFNIKIIISSSSRWLNKTRYQSQRVCLENCEKMSFASCFIYFTLLIQQNISCRINGLACLSVEWSISRA